MPEGRRLSPHIPCSKTYLPMLYLWTWHFTPNFEPSLQYWNLLPGCLHVIKPDLNFSDPYPSIIMRDQPKLLELCCLQTNTQTYTAYRKFLMTFHSIRKVHLQHLKLCSGPTYTHKHTHNPHTWHNQKHYLLGEDKNIMLCCLQTDTHRHTTFLANVKRPATFT